MLSLIPWSKHFARNERSNCYESNESFIKFVKIEYLEDSMDLGSSENSENENSSYFRAEPTSNEYGPVHSDLSYYNAGCMGPGNMFKSCHSWKNRNFYCCTWKTLQILMIGRTITDDDLDSMPPRLIRKIYSGLSDKDKIIAEIRYCEWVADAAWDLPHHYISVAKYIQMFIIGL